MKYKNKFIILLVVVLLLTGCTTTLKTEDKKVVKNPETGQSLTANILCKPTNEETIKAYEENGVDLAALPKCTEFSITSGGYEGLWTSLFVKPLAFIILFIMKFVKSAGLALILTSIALRLILYPVTKKTAMQSELIKKAKPDLDRLEKKYKDKTDQDSLMRKSQEMTMIYKKYNINPISGCLYSFIQLPLFIAFLEAINRVPAIFEENFLGIQLGTTPLVGFSSETFYMYIILLVIIGASTIFMFKTTNTQGSDPSMKMMPIMMSVIIIITAFFMPSALGIYWSVGNIFAIVQNVVVKRGMEKHGK